MPFVYVCSWIKFGMFNYAIMLHYILLILQVGIQFLKNTFMGLSFSSYMYVAVTCSPSAELRHLQCATKTHFSVNVGGSL